MLRELLSRDHERLDALLNALGGSTIDQQKYAEFRRGLLRHIGIEERILFPEMRSRGASTEVERQLHRDHAALAALLVPPPSAVEIDQIRAILDRHNPLEEESGGFYDRFERMAGADLPAVVSRVRDYPEVPTAPHADSPILRRSIAQLLREAEEGRKRLQTTDR
ncbi:MAG TPA: hemerythrin domain-containing protein [Thermoanaerobaculia bacterium]|nr:hemerythrin domain-containing protein [Thermoanaerobaculia bacterium]